MDMDKRNSGPAVPKRRRSIFVPLVFFALGVLCTYGYSYWKTTVKSPADKEMAASPTSHSEHAAPEKKPSEPKILYYVDPMNPSNRTDKPGKAPCGMDMVPVYEEVLSSENLPPGTVKLSPEKQQLIGVQFGEAAEMHLSKTIRAVGRAAYDETRIAHVHTKFPGWVEKVQVDFVGQLVKKGQPLFSIYSPELVATQHELLIAKKSKDYLENSQFEGLGTHSVALYKSTLERLRLWDISEAQVKQIEQKGEPIKSLTLYSALDGFVISRNVYSGQQVSPELELYTIADLSNVWVLAEVYEYEISGIHLGQKASVSFPSFKGKAFTGKVTYISPELDPKTRTARIRIELPNRDFLIKPDMFANVELNVDHGKKLSVPQEAVLDSGASQTVFVVRDGGYFEPRKVSLGPKVDDRFIVLEGLKSGEQVVTSANFLIDSESQLKSATGGMSASPHAGHGGASPVGETGSSSKPESVTDHSQHGGAAQSSPQGTAGVDHSQHGSAATPGSTPAVLPEASQEHAGHAHTGN
jgi:membrane fusion protein, copper/silver efflux system